MILAVMATGAMIVLAMPPCGFWEIGWFALMPVFWATRNSRLIVGVVCAIAATMVAAYIATTGVFYRQGSPEGEPTWIYLGCALFGFVFAIVAGVSSEVKDRSPRTLLILSFIGVLLDWCLLVVLPAPLALSQATFRPMLVLASVTGIWGISFALWFFNLAVVEAIEQRGKWLKIVMVVPAVSLLLGLKPLIIPAGKALTPVGVIQADSPNLSAFRGLSKAAARDTLQVSGAELVVWPEFSGMMFAPGGRTQRLTDLAKESGMPAFVTSYRDNFRPLPHNTATLFSSQGKSAPYFKRKLFGSESKMHSPGREPVAVPFGSTKVGLNICFDSCYPSIIRDTVRQGAEVIALPTIDPDSPYGFFAANHAAFTPIRAAENGVSIIRCDGYAYSTIADPEGSIVAQLGDVKDQFARANIPTHGHATIYRWAGDWFLYFCGGALLWAVFAQLRAKKQPTESASTEPRLPA